MKNKSYYSLFLILILMMLQYSSSASCNDVIQNAITYLITSDPGYTRHIYFQMSSLKAPAKFVGYSTGQFKNAYFFRGPPIYLRQSYLYAENVRTTFSDRTWCPNQQEGFFCFDQQNFDYQKVDISQISLYPTNSTAKIVLTTWGNATYTIPLECQNDFLYGTLKEPNGNSFIVISLKQQRIDIPR